MTGCEEAMVAGGRQKRPRSRHGRCIWRDIAAGQSRGMSAFVEIQKVPSNYLIRVRSCKFPLLIVFSQPGLSNENRPVFTFYRYLDVVNLNLSEKKFCQIRLR